MVKNCDMLVKQYMRMRMMEMLLRKAIYCKYLQEEKWSFNGDEKGRGSGHLTKKERKD